MALFFFFFNIYAPTYHGYLHRTCDLLFSLTEMEGAGFSGPALISGAGSVSFRSYSSPHQGSLFRRVLTKYLVELLWQVPKKRSPPGFQATLPLSGALRPREFRDWGSSLEVGPFCTLMYIFLCAVRSAHSCRSTHFWGPKGFFLLLSHSQAHSHSYFFGSIKSLRVCFSDALLKKNLTWISVG